MTEVNPEEILITHAGFAFRTLSVLNAWHFYDSSKPPVLEKLGDIAKLTRAELLRTPHCGKVTLEDIETVLDKYNLCLQDEPKKGKPPYEHVSDKIRVRELEEKNDRLLKELGYLEGEIFRVEIYKNKIAELEHRIVELEISNNRAWELVKETKAEQQITRDAATKAIQELQRELDRARSTA